MKPSKRITYHDCLTGKTPVPTQGPGKAIFQAMMVFSMVSIMFTFNWALRCDALTLESLLSNIYKYPLMIGLAFSMRLLFAEALSTAIKERFMKKLDGLPRSAAITAVNALIMAPLMSFFGSVLSYEGLNFTFVEYAFYLPFSMPVSFVVSLFLIAPLMKAIYNIWIGPELDRLSNRRSRQHTEQARAGAVRAHRMSVGAMPASSASASRAMNDPVPYRASKAARRGIPRTTR